MADAHSDVIGWLREQHPWLQEAALRILSGRTAADKGLTDADVLDLLREMEAAPGASSTPKAFPTLAAADAGSADLKLVSIGEISGVDSLAPHEPLAFGIGNLAVVYGGNGSGKSGYTRILKKACGKPLAHPLMSDVFKPAPAQKKCTLKYKVGSAEKTVAWDTVDPVPDLGSVDIFDAHAGRIYLTGETKAAYVPPAVALFEDLVKACERMTAAIDARKKALPSKLPALPQQFSQAAAGKAFASLANVKTEAEVGSLLKWDEADARRLAELDERLGPSDPTELARKKTLRRASVESLKASIAAALSATDETAFARGRTLAADAAAKRTAAREGAAALSSSAKLDGVGAETWRGMWEAARAYSENTAYPSEKFPVVGDGGRCPLCHQDLDGDAKARLRRFEEYVGGSLELAAAAAEKARDDALSALPTRPDDADLSVACQAAGLDDERQLAAVRGAWDAIEKRAGLIRRAANPVDAAWAPPSEFQVIGEMDALAATLEGQAKQHSEDAKSFDRAKVSLERLQLQCRQWTAQQAAAIREELGRLKEVRRLDGLKSLANSGPISKKLGQVSNELITDAYVARFNLELAALAGQRSQPLMVELVKVRVDRGKTIHRIQLKGVVISANPDQVLSEGEFRVVSLAAFLADTTANARKTPFVFDDPISSLDLDFEWAVARRLADLAKSRQVVVFTHRLSLYGFMDDAAGKHGEKWKKDHLAQKCVERFGGATGRPVADSVWTMDTAGANDALAKRLGEAKRNFYDVGDSTGYRQLAQGICSDFRKLLERTVESDLLNKVVLRHRRSVTTDNRVGQLAKISKEDCVLLEGLMSKYSCFEHSQSSETPVEVPDEPDLRSDIERLKEWRTKFKSRAA